MSGQEGEFQNRTITSTHTGTRVLASIGLVLALCSKRPSLGAVTPVSLGSEGAARLAELELLVLVSLFVNGPDTVLEI